MVPYFLFNNLQKLAHGFRVESIFLDTNTYCTTTVQSQMRRPRCGSTCKETLLRKTKRHQSISIGLQTTGTSKKVCRYRILVLYLL